MGETLRVYSRIVLARFRAQLSYRVSFALDLFAQAITQLTELVVILTLFRHVDALGGFAAHEVLLIYALAGISFGLADMAVGQLDHLPTLIRTGWFDVLLLRPLGTLPQLATLDVQLRRLGRVLVALAVLGYALVVADPTWTPARVALLVVTPLTGTVIFGSIWVMGCAVCFWVVDGRELANSVTYGGSLLTSYPITIFPGWLRRFLAFLVPGAFVAYYPTLALLDRPDPLGLPPLLLAWLGPVVAAATAALAGLTWRFAVRHYRGTGS